MTLYNDAIPNSIIPMLLMRIRDHLQTAMMYDVAESNPTRAVVVKVGRFIKNPIDKNITIGVNSGDYEDPAFLDGRIDNSKFDGLKIRNLPVGEIGGGVYWWRRGSINLSVFFVRQRFQEDIAMQHAYDVYSRLLKALEQTPFPSRSESTPYGLQDDYGERAYPPLYLEAASFFESGGGQQFIWRGKVLWRVLTWRP